MQTVFNFQEFFLKMHERADSAHTRDEIPHKREMDFGKYDHDR
jgi:hypothetical protein